MMLWKSVSVVVLAATVMIATVLGCSAGSPSVAASQKAAAAAAEGPEVKIDNFSFTPPMLAVAVGTTVTWINRDDVPHTVVSTEKVFKSKVLDTDEKFSYTFDKAGSYPYFCSLHPKMTGTVVVQ